MHCLGRSASVLILAALAAPTGAAEPIPADALIEAAKQAMGGPAWDSTVTWHETGTGTAGGLDGTYEVWADLPSLRNSFSYVLGPTTGGSGWDGKQAWTTDNSKEVRIETSDEAAAQAIQDAYRRGYAFFFPDRFPATREDAGTRQADGKNYDAVKVTPKGAEPFEIWFDPATHLIAREVQLTGANRHLFILSDFSRFDEIVIPGKTIDRIGGDPKFDIVLQPGTISRSAAEQDSRYAPPPPPPNSAQWPTGRASVTVPFRLLNNHIYVAASINGKPPLPFMFDTGATDDIQTSAAKKLGIPVEGALGGGGGFGDKIEEFGFAKIESVSLGGLTLSNQVFSTETSPAWVPVEGTDVAGLLGYEFVKRAVLTIDYAKRIITFTKPEAFHPPRDAAALPITFDSHIPMLSGTLDGIPGEFELDTGSRGALSVMHPFAEANGLVRKYHATHSAITGYGVGGPSRALLARAGKLIIGPVTIEAPVTEIGTDTTGADDDARTAGNIGGDLLKRFTVTLDYGRQTVWLQPNRSAGRREVFDRSGLWIGPAADGGIAIVDVTTESAAAEIGLTTGDEIVAVNGQPAKSLALYALRERFKGAVGTQFHLLVRSKAGDRALTLTLADQV